MGSFKTADGQSLKFAPAVPEEKTDFYYTLFCEKLKVQGNLGHATAAFTLDVYGRVSERMKDMSNIQI